MSNWIDVDQGLPDSKDAESSVTVLCWLALDFVVSGWYSPSDDEWYDFNGDLIDDVYYWQDMPEGPEEGAK